MSQNPSPIVNDSIEALQDVLVSTPFLPPLTASRRTGPFASRSQNVSQNGHPRARSVTSQPYRHGFQNASAFENRNHNTSSDNVDWSVWEQVVENGMQTNVSAPNRISQFGPTNVSSLKKSAQYQQSISSDGVSQFQQENVASKESGAVKELFSGRNGSIESDNLASTKDENDFFANLIDAFPGVGLKRMSQVYAMAGKDPNLTAEILASGMNNIDVAIPIPNVNSQQENGKTANDKAGSVKMENVNEEGDCLIVANEDNGWNIAEMCRSNKQESLTKSPRKSVSKSKKGIVEEQGRGFMDNSPEKKLQKTTGEPSFIPIEEKKDSTVHFLYSLFGEELNIGFDIIQDVYDGCGGDLNKSSEILLKLTEVCDEPSDVSPTIISETDKKSGGLSDLLQAFPNVDEEHIVITFQLNNEDVGKTAFALLAYKSGSPEKTNAGVGTSQPSLPETPAMDPIKKANMERLKRAFPLINLDMLESVLQASNNSFKEACNIMQESGISPVPGQHVDSAWTDPPPSLSPPPPYPSLTFPPPPLPVFDDRKQKNCVPPNNLDSENQREREQDSIFDRQQRDYGDRSRGGEDLYHTERKEANEYAKLKKFYFTEASKAFRQGNPAIAASLSQEGHRYGALLRQSNEAASKRIVKIVNRRHRSTLKLDLHHLHVEDALREVEAHINSLKHLSSTVACLEIVTGKGLHSMGGAAKIRPAVEGYLNDMGVGWSRHATNPGVLVVHFDDGRG